MLEMSDFEKVVVGKLKLKGKALDVKTNGMKKKKRKHHKIYDHHLSLINQGEIIELFFLSSLI